MSADEIKYEVMDVEYIAFLKQRVRELEHIWNEIKEGHEDETDKVITLIRRISKAQEILERLVVTPQGKEIMQAIAVLKGQDALEGK